MTGIRGAAASSRGRSAKSDSRARIVVPFDQNERLATLFGEGDAHLSLIEDRLGIEAHANGNVVVLVGSEPSCAIARDVLHALYNRIGDGDVIGPADVDGLIRHSLPAETIADDDDHDGAPAQIATRRKAIIARTPAQSRYMKAMQTLDLVFGIGPAGTGKTYLAVAHAAQCLERGSVERIILSRPAVEAGERLGFLPGDLREKVDPYLRPLYDALYDVLPPEKVDRDLENGIIEVAPLAFMRGRTLSNAYVILDEAQNTTSMQMKMFLTRLGEGSKMVVTGDPSQIDLPPGQQSGLEQAVGLLDRIEDVAAIRFKGGDVVRRELVLKIVNAYEIHEKAAAARKRDQDRDAS